MKNTLYLSERKAGFQFHTSLTDDSLFFETNQLRGCIFYLPSSYELGGDAFIITGDSYLTIFLLGDMAEHGKEGRDKLNPFISDLERMVKIAKTRNFGRKLIREIVNLDNRLGDENMISLSFLHISSEGDIFYLNEGENQLMLCKSGKVCNPSEAISHGKIGLLNLIPDKDRLVDEMKPLADRLVAGDKILLCTDGVFEYMEDADFAIERKKEVEDMLASSNPIGEIIKGINKSTKIGLERIGKSKPPDDYTIIGFEIKKWKEVLYT